MLVQELDIAVEAAVDNVRVEDGRPSMSLAAIVVVRTVLLAGLSIEHRNTDVPGVECWICDLHFCSEHAKLCSASAWRRWCLFGYLATTTRVPLCEDQLCVHETRVRLTPRGAVGCVEISTSPV